MDIALNISPEVPDLTDDLQPDKKRFVTRGAFGVVYHCPCTTGREVALKAAIFPLEISDDEKEMLKRKLKREFGIWRRLDHPNIVPFLGKAHGIDFGFDYDCMVSKWMPRETLNIYVKKHADTLGASRLVQLIKDIANGLNYLHSRNIVHGDLHPGNVLLDDAGNARLTDFGLSQVLLPIHDGLSYLRTMSAHPGALIWAAPELVYPKLYPDWNKDGKPRATLNNDVHALGSMILFILSGKMPWPDVPTALKQLEKREIPQHREFSAIPNGVWKFLKKCWSPTKPGARPSAEEVLSYVSDTLENVLNLPPRDSFGGFLSRFRSVTQPYPIFRLLIIGNVMAHLPSYGKKLTLFQSGVGKSALVHRVFGVESVYTSDTTPGITRIDQEHISLTNDCLVVHDSLGFEASDEGNMDIIQGFIARRNAMFQPKDHVHAVWLCLEIPYSGGQLIDAGVEKFLRRRSEILGKVPLVVVLTQMDLLDEQLKLNLPANETLGDYKSRYLKERFIEPLRGVAGTNIEYAVVSVKDGHENTLSDLVKVTEKLAPSLSGKITWNLGI